MVLSTHAVIGGLLGAALMRSPEGALVLGVASHFALDALPHWDYHLSSMSEKHNILRKNMHVRSRAFLFDLAKISLDLALGALSLLLALGYLGWPLSLVAVLGAVGGVLPDFLQFAYFKLRWRVLLWLQRFHEGVHTPHRLGHWPILGPLLQVVLVLVFVAIIRQ